MLSHINLHTDFQNSIPNIPPNASPPTWSVTLKRCDLFGDFSPPSLRLVFSSRRGECSVPVPSVWRLHHLMHLTVLITLINWVEIKKRGFENTSKQGIMRLLWPQSPVTLLHFHWLASTFCSHHRDEEHKPFINAVEYITLHNAAGFSKRWQIYQCPIQQEFARRLRVYRPISVNSLNIKRLWLHVRHIETKPRKNSYY